LGLEPSTQSREPRRAINPEMSDEDSDERPVTKATMDAPQEEFITDQSVPSAPKQVERDRDHGDEADAARQRNEAHVRAEEEERRKH
jgi:hypothetical protein